MPAILKRIFVVVAIVYTLLLIPAILKGNWGEVIMYIMLGVLGVVAYRFYASKFTRF